MSDLNQNNAKPREPASFETTQWSLIVRAGHASEMQRREALATLCERYWFPLYAYARRRCGDPESARDATQSFFAQLLDSDFVANADSGRGSFRAYLITAMRNFLAKQWAAGKAQKRGGGRCRISLDFASAESRFSIEPATTETADLLFDRDWAVTLLQQVLNLLQNEMRADGKEQQFDLLKGSVIGDHSQNSYAGLAQQLGMNEATARMAASRMRTRYRELLRREISQTVATPDEIDDEIRSLFRVLARPE